MEGIIMVRQVKVSNFVEVEEIVSAAAKCYNDVGVHDNKGSIADAKSILGMMSLDYSHPVKIICEDEKELNRVMHALRQ
jgi:phosphotransferase system HPr-like phosphotransfer protein